MQTPLETLIEQLDYQINNEVLQGGSAAVALIKARDAATALLPEERKKYEGAYNQGYRDGESCALAGETNKKDL